MGVDGRRDAPEEPPAFISGGWLGPRVDQGGFWRTEIPLSSTGVQTADRPARSE